MKLNHETEKPVYISNLTGDSAALQLPEAQWILNRWMVAVVNCHWKHSHLITKNPGKPLYIISNLSFCHISGSNQKSQSGCYVAYWTQLQSGGAQKCHIVCKNPHLSSIAELAITVKWLTQYELMYCPHLYALFASPAYAPTMNIWETECLGEDTLHILLQCLLLMGNINVKETTDLRKCSCLWLFTQSEASRTWADFTISSCHNRPIDNWRLSVSRKYWMQLKRAGMNRKSDELMAHCLENAKAV